MTANVSCIDRTFAFSQASSSSPGGFSEWPVGDWIGVLTLATGLLRICPAYRLPGINPCGLNK